MGQGAAHSRLHQAGVATYRSWHRSEHFPVEMTELVKEAGFTKYAIYRDGVDLFSYFEADDLDLANARMRNDRRCQAWLVQMAPLMDVAEPQDPWHPIEETFWLP